MLKKSILNELQSFIKMYKTDHLPMFDLVKDCYQKASAPMTEIEEWIEEQKEKKTFSKLILDFIDKKGFEKDSDFYKKAGLDRRHFSKIRSNKDYKPKKETAFALILALELDEDEAKQCLSAAGLSFNYSNTKDLIILFCINKSIYDINEVNFALDYFSQKSLMVSE